VCGSLSTFDIKSISVNIVVNIGKIGVDQLPQASKRTAAVSPPNGYLGLMAE